MEEQRTSYNGTIGLRLRGRLDVAALRLAFDALVARHEPLRTTFAVPGEGLQPVQVIARSCKLHIEVDAANEGDVLAQMDQLAGHIYDLRNGPLFVVRLLRLAEQHHVLLIGMHHIIYDAWSQFNVMSRDVRVLYAAATGGHAAQLPPLLIQYADYAVWQRRQDFSADLHYWKQRLAGYRDGLELPYDNPRPVDRNWPSATVSHRYPAALARDFARFNRSHEATLFMGLLASFSVVLGQYTGREDLCIGTTTAGRHRLELENLIGFFINILALRLDLSGDPDIGELMQRARRTVLGAFEHQGLPFEHVLNALQRQRDSSQIPLVPVILRHQNFPTAHAEPWDDGLHMEVIERDERTTPNEMDWQFFGDNEGLEVTVEYAAPLFTEATVRRLIRHHEKVMAFMVESLGEARRSA